jgi:DNA gyrase subunit A
MDANQSDFATCIRPFSHTIKKERRPPFQNLRGRKHHMKQLIDKQHITRALEENYMPYAMSVIISRAIPEIDGFKPSHRKLLYTMYKMGLLPGARTKSANIVGQTMKLNPHGDMAIYETMVRISKGYEALLHPYVDSKGNFGKHYSRDMAFAASRYTEAKLSGICADLFADIDKDTVDFIDNYDSTMKEPTLLPCSFPNVLVNANQGIAVGMASSICSFNLREICETTIALIKNPDHHILSTLLAPDFSTGGELIFSQQEMEQIYKTGRGSFKVRAKYTYDKGNNCIEITEIPYTTTCEAIIDRIIDLVKGGKIKDISDIRDETALSGLKITIDLKRGVDPEKLMARLFKLTTLQDTFSCNFNILVAGTPKVMGIQEILDEWMAFRVECLKRGLHFDLNRKKERLHLLTALNKILLDIDKAITIVRDTEEDSEVIPNLMIGFGIDEVQAEFIAEIRLRNLNRQYILKVLSDTDQLKAEIEQINLTLSSRQRVEKIIISQLQGIAKKYGESRKTSIVYTHEIEEFDEESLIEDYAVNLFLTKEGYFKKITPLSLRMGGEHKLKDKDEILQQLDATNKNDIIFFTNQCRAYKARVHDFDDTKASVLGDFLPVKLGFEPGEIPVCMAVTSDYGGNMMFFFENGRVSKVPLSAYETKTNRKKLTGAFCNKFPLVFACLITEEKNFVLVATSGKILTADSLRIPAKPTRSSQGIIVMTLKGKHKLTHVYPEESSPVENPLTYRPRNLPSPGYSKKDPDQESDQLSLI